MELAVVDRVAPPYADEVASLLREAGLHPKYDDLPRLIVHNNIPTMHSRIAVYVPAEEADAARQVLAAYYDETHLHQRERMKNLPPWHKGFVMPGLISIGMGVLVWLGSGNPVYGLGAWLVSLIVAVQAIAYLRR